MKNDPFELTPEMERIIVNIRHITFVQALLESIAQQLQARAVIHDISKFQQDEFDGFIQLNRASKEHGYGTPEYLASIQDNEAVKLHTSRNRHHPEYHPNGVADMTLIDFIEMVADWAGANLAYGDGGTFEDSLETSIARFKLTDQQAWLARLIAAELKGMIDGR